MKTDLGMVNDRVLCDPWRGWGDVDILGTQKSDSFPSSRRVNTIDDIGVTTTLHARIAGVELVAALSPQLTAGPRYADDGGAMPCYLNKR
jgi:hypothetical protein